MSAPRFFPPSRSLRIALLWTACALVAAGCTVPGSSRLEGPPEDLPPSLDLVSADVLGYWLVDTDAESELWAPFEPLVGSNDPGDDPARNGVVDRLHEPLLGPDPETSDWIGDAAGIAIREIDTDEPQDTNQLYFADVADRAALEDALEDAGWRRDADADLPAPADEGELWVLTPEGSQGRAFDPYRMAAVTDDAIIASVSTKGLHSWLRSADEYAVPERKAMREFTVEAAKRTPVAFVYRADLIRTQVRRPFQDDPALLEFARWATDSNVLIALRDGWLGVAPAVDRGEQDDRLRIVGSGEWVPDLAPDITLGQANPDLLAEFDPATTDAAIAIHDPGQQISELVRSITIGAGQYVTPQDVAEEDERLELEPLLDRLDGDAALGIGNGELRFVFEDGGGLAADVEAALEHAGVSATARAEGNRLGSVTIDLPGTRGRPARGGAGDAAAAFRDMTGAGKPPQAPWLWLVGDGGECWSGDTAGWLAFDGVDRMTLGLDVAATPDEPGCGSLVGLLPIR